MPSVDSLDFLNTNSLRNYPIKEGVSRTSVEGAIVIPNDLIVDFQIAASYDPSKNFYLSKLSNFEDSIAIEVTESTSGILAGVFTIIRANHWQYKDYYLISTENFVGAMGTLTINTLDSIRALPSGIFLFSPATAMFEMRTSIPSLKGINRLVFSNTSGDTFYLSGDVVIEARTNVRFKLDESEANKIIIDAGEGIGLNTICSGPTQCIKTIDGIPPDNTGNFTLDFSDCATFTPIPANTGLLLEDVCCKPCLGCNDIEILTTRLMTAETGLLTLNNYYASLVKLFDDFKTTSTYTCACPPPS